MFCVCFNNFVEGGWGDGWRSKCALDVNCSFLSIYLASFTWISLVFLSFSKRRIFLISLTFGWRLSSSLSIMRRFTITRTDRNIPIRNHIRYLYRDIEQSWRNIIKVLQCVNDRQAAICIKWKESRFLFYNQNGFRTFEIFSSRHRNSS